ncbi:MAG TPA: hypothetical protein VK004_06235, partial [Ignavibacteria bacterium]|nr:hypothetical protein [Ignavibacteria bacterium]
MKKILYLYLIWICAIGAVYLAVNNNKPLPESRHLKKYQPSDWFHYQRSYPNEEIPYEKYYDAIEMKVQMEQNSPMRGLNWIPAGPYNIGGRITAMTVDPGNTNIIIAGTAAG